MRSQRIHILAVGDDFTRDDLALIVDTSLSGTRVARDLGARPAGAEINKGDPAKLGRFEQKVNQFVGAIERKFGRELPAFAVQAAAATGYQAEAAAARKFMPASCAQPTRAGLSAASGRVLARPTGLCARRGWANPCRERDLNELS